MSFEEGLGDGGAETLLWLPPEDGAIADTSGWLSSSRPLTAGVEEDGMFWVHFGDLRGRKVGSVSYWDYTNKRKEIEKNARGRMYTGKNVYGEESRSVYIQTALSAYDNQVS